MELKENMEKRLEDYMYGRFNLLNNEFGIEKIKDGLKIIDFYGGDLPKMGSCGELTSRFYEDNDDLDLLMVEGKEPRYFFLDTSTHYYLLNLKEDFPNDFKTFSEKEQFEYFSSSGAIVIDPAFKFVEEFKDSGYEVKKYIRGFKDKKNVDLVNNGSMFPLGLENDLLLYIGMRDFEPHFFSQEKYSNEIKSFLWDDQNFVFSLKGDLEKTVMNFQEKYSKMAPRNLLLEAIFSKKGLKPSEDEIFCEHQNID